MSLGFEALVVGDGDQASSLFERLLRGRVHCIGRLRDGDIARGQQAISVVLDVSGPIIQLTSMPSFRVVVRPLLDDIRDSMSIHVGDEVSFEEGPHVLARGKVASVTQ